MKIGILGAGRIATLMAKTLKQMEGVTCYAVASRDEGRAATFAKDYGFEKSYGSYERLVNDSEVELIYIATPHSHHYEHAKLCIEHGKPVLCEKSFTINEAQAKEIFKLAKEKKVFITEAIWTRYMPSRELIKQVIESGILGKITFLEANLGYAMMDKERIVDPALAGGALLDVGVYTLNFARMCFDEEIKEIHSTAILSDRGVDLQNEVTLTYQDGKMAILHSTAQATTSRQGVVCGDKGYMIVENINNCEAIKIYSKKHQVIKEIEIPKQITGYEYEVIAAMKAIKEGKLECEEMPHQETLYIMRMMDALRKEWGIIYPQEK